jgi:magnesium-protoporphyrin O-methyltransferase
VSPRDVAAVHGLRLGKRAENGERAAVSTRARDPGDGRYSARVAGCCCRQDYDRFFGRRFARSVARKYRKRGLDKTSRRMVEFLRQRGIEGATVLEIGGGIGEIELELLKAGAARAQNLELSHAYEQQARELAEEAGLAERVEWRIHDIAADPESVEPADIVVLHRVVCCYPDYERLLGAAAGRARRALVFSHPPRNTLSRAFYCGFNLVMWLMRSSFRGFAHPPAAMRDVLERHGLRQTYEHRGRLWQIAGHELAP